MKDVAVLVAFFVVGVGAVLMVAGAVGLLVEATRAWRRHP